MQDGKKFSRIVDAIARAEERTTGEIRVHLSRRRFERDPMARARKIFMKTGMEKTSQRNAVLLYVNLRRRQFAIFGDSGIHDNVGQKYWEKIARELAQDLRGTHHENAIGMAVERIGDALAKHFPASAGNARPNQLSNEVLED